MRPRHILPQPLERGITLRALMCLCWLALLAGWPSSAPTQSRQDSGDRERSLSALRVELERLDADYKRVNAQADDIVGRVGRLRKAIEIQQLKVREAQAALSEAIDGVTLAEQNLAAVEAEGEELRTRLEQRSKRLYRLGRWGTLRLFFSLQKSSLEVQPASETLASPSQVDQPQGGVDALAGLRLLRAVVRQDARGMALVEANRVAASSAADEVERRKVAARSWLDEQRQINARLATRRREEQAALRALAQRREQIEGQLAGVRTRHDRLNRLLEILGDEGPSGLGGLPIEDFKGALDWPVLGALVRRFGPYRDSQYGTLVPHNGLTVSTQFGDAVQAVYPGRVVYSGQFRDVGLVVVLQHSRDALTMYSGLSAADVAEGDIVSLGEQVGTAARELYFEIRAGKSAEDPLTWLSAAG